MCRLKKKTVQVISDENINSYSDNEIFINAIERVIATVSDSGVPTWREMMQLNNVDIEFKIDTGSDVNVISKHLLDRIEPNVIIKNERNILKCFGGNKIRALGTNRIDCVYHNIEHNIECVVVDFDTAPIMSLQSSIDFGLVDISDEARLERLKLMNGFF